MNVVDWDSNSIWLSCAALLLVLLNAVFVCSEFSLIRLRYSHFNPDLLEELRKSKRFSRLLEEVDRTLRYLRLGISSSTVLLGVVLIPFVDSVSSNVGLEVEGLWKYGLYLLSFLFAIGIHYVIGESVPRGVALQHPVVILQASYWFIWSFRLLTRPFMRLLVIFSRMVLRLARLNPDINLNELDLVAQIRSLDEDTTIPAFTQRVFRNVISMRDLVVQDVMLPRNLIQYFNSFDSNEVNIALSKTAGHTRFPLCEGDLDNCLGIIHIKDIYSSDLDVSRMDFKKLARPLLYVGPNDTLEAVLEKLLDDRSHMALVRDEFGGTVGVVTMENIVEQLVGNIQDEFDSEDEQIEEIREDVFIVDGLTPIHEVEEKLDLEIEEDAVSTIGGLITSELGKIPEVGQTVQLNNIEIKALEVDEKRVLSAQVKVIQDDPVE